MPIFLRVSVQARTICVQEMLVLAVNDCSSGSPKPAMSATAWNISPSEEEGNRGDHWRHFDNSVNAVSFGFVATAILISMFLVMAIFERFLRPRSAFSSPQNGRNVSLEPPDVRIGLQFADKFEDSSPVSTYARGVSVLMPGQDIPTFIAHPVPVPCPPEGVAWPLHEQGYYLGSSSLEVRSPSTDQPRAGETAAETGFP